MTSHRKTEPTSFINLDLEVFSESDLGELVDYLSKELCLLHDGLIDGSDHACFEVRPSKPSDDPNEFIAVFHGAIKSLPPSLQSLWKSCNRRLLDIGFQSGWKPNVFTTALSKASMERLADLQTDFVITIYGTSTACKTWQRA